VIRDSLLIDDWGLLIEEEERRARTGATLEADLKALNQRSEIDNQQRPKDHESQITNV
jgi:hypothetical protein